MTIKDVIEQMNTYNDVELIEDPVNIIVTNITVSELLKSDIDLTKEVTRIRPADKNMICINFK